MTDTALNTSRAALKTKIDTAIGTASIDDARKLAKIAKLIGESDNTSFETAVNTRINSLATSATTDELVKLAETIGFVTDTTTSSALLDLSAIQQNLVPDTTDIRNLGSASKQWDNLYLNAGTIQTTPSAADHIVNKAYVDSRTVTTGDIIPDVADTHDLGSSSKKYVEVHTARVLGLSATPTVAGEAASKAYVDSEVGALTSVSTSAPSSPNNGDFWFDSANAALLISYDDGSGSQWVEVSGFSGGAGATGSGGAGVTTYALLSDLPTSGNTQGDLGFVTATKALYVWDGTSWANSNGGAGVTTYALLSGLPTSGNTQGDLGFVTATKALYVWDGTSWANSNANTTFYMLRAGNFVAPLTGTKTFSPDRTVSLQTLTATIEQSVSAAVIFSINKNGSELQQFTIPTGQNTVTANFTTNSILTTDILTLDVDSGSGENLTVKVDYV